MTRPQGVPGLVGRKKDSDYAKIKSDLRTHIDLHIVHQKGS